MSALKKPCPVCHGRGVVPREVRKLPGGTPDPLDFRREELCPTCGGGGSVPDAGPSAEPARKSAGYIADAI